ncbi:MAG: hypothetical protein AAGF11_45505 [Myxococcota bacterium]
MARGPRRSRTPDHHDAQQRPRVNALLEQRGMEARVGKIVVRLGPPLTVDLVIDGD